MSRPPSGVGNFVSDDLKLSIILQAVDNTKAAVDAAVASIGRVETEAKSVSERAAMAMLGNYKHASEETFAQLRDAFWASKSAPKVEIVPAGAMAELNGFKSAVETLKRDFSDISKQAGGAIDLDSGLAKRAAENYKQSQDALRGVKKDVDDLAAAGKQAAEKVGEIGSSSNLEKIKTFGAALVAAGVGYKAFSWVKGAVTDAAELGEKLDQLAARTGLSAEILAGIKFASEQSNATLEASASAIGRLETKMAAAAAGSKKAAEDLRSIGVTAKEPLEAFRQVSEAIAATKDPIEQSRIATEAFGKGWQSIMGLLKQSPESMDALFKAGQRYYQDANALAENANRYKNSLAEIDTAVGSLKLKFGADLLEPISRIAAGMADAAREGKPFEAVLRGIGGAFAEFPITTSITALVGGLVGSAAAIGAWHLAAPALTALFPAMAAALPVMAAAAPAVATMVGAFAAWKVGDAVGTWLSGQIDEMVKAVTGDKAATLGTALYDLMEGPDGVLTWANKVAASGGVWAVAGRALMDGLRSGIAAGLKGALGIGEKLSEGIAYIKSTAAQWAQVGRDIIQGLIDGVAAKAKEVVDKIRGLGSSVVREMKDLLGIKSPSQVFAEIGQNVGAGMAEGIEKTTAAVKQKAENQAKGAVDAAQKGVIGALESTTATVKKLDANYDKAEATVKSLVTGYDSLVAAIEKGDITATAEAALKSIETMTASAKTLQTTYKDTMKGVSDLAGQFGALKPAADALNNVMPAMTGWVSGLASAAWASISSGITAVGAAMKASLLPLMANPIVMAIVGTAAAGTAVYLYWDEISAAVEKAMDAVAGALDAASEKVNTTLGAWRDFGMNLAQSVKDGVAIGLKGALGIGKKFEDAVATMKATVSDWIGVGRDIIQGLIDGVAAKAKEVVDKIRGLGSSVVREMKDLLGIKSPSRVFMAIGEDIGAGLVVGIAASEEDVRKAVEGLGEAAIYAGDEATLRFIREQEQAIRELRGEVGALGATAQRTGAQARDWWGRFLPDDAAAALAATGERASEDIGRSLTDALLRGFESGKGYAENFSKTLRDLFGSMVLKPLIQPVATGAAGLVTGGLSALLPGNAAASGFASAGGFGGSDVLGLLGNLTSADGIGIVAGGIAESLGASAAMAGGIGSFVSMAVPVVGAIAALASIFGSQPSGKYAHGSIDLASGDVFDRGSQTGSKYSKENNDAVDAMLSAAKGYTEILRAMGGTLTGSHRFTAGDTYGYGFDVVKGEGGFRSSDREAFLGHVFDTLIAEADGLDATLAELLRTFEGSAEEAANFAAALKMVTDYTRADLVVDAMEQIRLAGRTTWQIWSDGRAEVGRLAVAFDGSLSSAQALGAATSAMYQSELTLIGQIQGMLASTSAMFGDSIRTIEMSVLDSAGKYDYLRAEIDAAYASLGAAVDPQAIGDLASQINRLTMEAFGLLDETQRRDVADEYTGYLEEVNRLTSERLNLSQAQVESQHADMVSAIESAMERVADRMEAAAAAQQAAASTPVTVESRVSVDVQVDTPANVEVGYG